ncbi:unnamed protein product [Sphenostylis stenocarpa]|uniref:Uncharacterized protein n=1 Tax=Sphenostylis stenocarpa TaxID=92480 RepID=A0AA86W2G3_9FABA|nr:unnamed protein product [Sphenostylis stenocarpa]
MEGGHTAQYLTYVSMIKVENSQNSLVIPSILRVPPLVRSEVHLACLDDTPDASSTSLLTGAGFPSFELSFPKDKVDKHWEPRLRHAVVVMF